MSAIGDVRAVEALTASARSPFAMHLAEIGGNACRVYTHAPQTLNDIYRRARPLRDKCFVTAGEVELTIGNVFEGAERIAALLASRYGVIKGTRIGLALADDLQWIVWFVAITSMRAVAVLIDNVQDDVQAERCLLARCMLVVSTAAADICQAGNPERVLVRQVRELGVGGDFDALPRSNSQSTSAPLAADDDAVIAFTSGSSGNPKAAILTHRGIITGLWNMMLAGAIAAAERKSTIGAVRRRPLQPCALLLSPLAHVAGYTQLLLMLQLGGRIALLEQWSDEAALAAIERRQVTALIGATAPTLRELLQHLPAGKDVTSLSFIAMTGTALPDVVRRDIAWALPDVGVGTGYGMTETNGTVCSPAPASLPAEPFSCGRLLPSVDCKIVEPDGNELGAGGIGEIWLRGAMLMRGYCGSPPLVDGWFRTGDAGYLSAGECLHLLGRQDELIPTAKGPVPCQSIEQHLSEWVGEVVALCGEDRGLIHVVVKADNDVDFARLRAQLAQAFHVEPLRWRFLQLSVIPRTRSGKVDRKRLKTELGI